MAPPEIEPVVSAANYGLKPGRRAKLFERIVQQAVERADHEKSFEAVPSGWDRLRLWTVSMALQQAIVDRLEVNGVQPQTFLIERDNAEHQDLGYLVVHVVERNGVTVQERIEPGSDSPLARPGAAYANPPLSDTPQWQLAK